MTDNQKALDALANLSFRAAAQAGSFGTVEEYNKVYSDIETVRSALTAQPVSDDEVREAVVSAREIIKHGFIPDVHRWEWLETLIRAATAPKNCDNQHLIDLADRSAKRNLELQDQIDALVKALEKIHQGTGTKNGEYQRSLIMSKGIMRDIAYEALAAHRAQEGK